MGAACAVRTGVSLVGALGVDAAPFQEPRAPFRLGGACRIVAGVFGRRLAAGS